MNRHTLEKRLQELGIYSDFYYRKELKPLAQVLGEQEQLNCMLTGVHEGNRKMLVVTDQRLLILFAAALGDKAITVIRRDAVKDWQFEKKLLFSRLSVSTRGGEVFEFSNTQGSLKELFEWAMKRPLPQTTE